MTEEQIKKAIDGSLHIAAERDTEFSSALLGWAEAHGYTKNLQDFISTVIAVVIHRLQQQ